MREKTKNRIVIFFLTLIFIATYMLSPFSNMFGNITVVEASRNIKGTEDAEDEDEFDTPGDQQLYKCWSVIKSLEIDGKKFTDEQACGILGCWQAESGGSFASWVVEGFLGNFDTWDDVNKYIGETSSKFADDHDSMTVTCLKNGYGVADDGITTGRAGYTMPWPGHSKGLSGATYFPASRNHEGWCGIGLGQYTGERAALLVDFCTENKCDWWLIDNQLIYIFTDTADGGDYNANTWSTYMTDTASSDLDTCTQTFFLSYEMPGGKASDYADFISTRQKYAQDLYDDLHGKPWDSSYGASILDGTGLKSSKMHTDIVDRSILFSYASAAIHYPLNSGYILPIADTDSQDMYNKNADVYKGLVNEFRGDDNKSKKYCLFELYGEDIHWYRYLGEATYAPNLADHIWSAVVQNKVSKLISFDTINYESTNYVSCRVYKTRPYVLSSKEVNQGYSDPRVLTMITSYFSGDFYVIGSFELFVSKLFVSLVSFLMGPSILEAAKSIIESIQDSDIWGALQPLILVMLGFAMIAFILSLVGKVKNYAMGRGGSPKDIIERFLIGFIMLGFLLASTYNPKAFNNIGYNAACIIDSFFNASLTKSVKNDDVIGVSDDDLAVRAVLWKTAIFEPWCKGQFGKSYKKLYTQYATDLKPGEKKMAQSHSEVDTSDMTGKAFFNSASYTGDVWVSIGGDTKIRNWAALLYSCGSQYHIDCDIADQAVEKVSDRKFKGSFTTNIYSDVRNKMVKDACTYVGKIPYIWGGESLDTGVDCSGFMMCLYSKHANISLPHSAQGQYNDSQVTHISEEDLIPGDLVFFGDTDTSIGHVAMYIGNGQVVHASCPEDGLKISDINYRSPRYYGRVSNVSSYKDDASSGSSNSSNDNKYIVNLDKPVAFPVANTTAYDADIMADTFRVVDAQMNIAPQEFADGTTISSYTNSKYLDPSFLSQGFFMIIHAGLLLFLIPPIWKRLKNFILLLILSIQLIWYTITELFKEGNFKDFGTNIKNALLGYFIGTIQMYTMVILYSRMVGKGLLLAIIYCILCIIILSFSAKDMNDFISQTRRRKMVAKNTAVGVVGGVAATGYAAKKTAENIKNAPENIKTGMQNTANKIKSTPDNIKNSAKIKAQEVKNKIDDIKETPHNIKQKAEDTINDIKNTPENIKNNAKNKAKDIKNKFNHNSDPQDSDNNSENSNNAEYDGNNDDTTSNV